MNLVIELYFKNSFYPPIQFMEMKVVLAKENKKPLSFEKLKFSTKILSVSFPPPP